MLNETLVEYILLACVLLAIFLPSLSGRIAMPVLQVLARWIRWFLFAALFAFVLHLTEWSTRPDWVHFVFGGLLWFLLETGLTGSPSRRSVPVNFLCFRASVSTWMVMNGRPTSN